MAALTAVQMREFFAQEADIRLPQLGQLLMQLEQSGDDPTLIQSIFREFHTLKGSSAVAGLTDVTALAHDLEELVDGLRTGQRSATPELIDALLVGTDELTALIASAPPTALPAVPTVIAAQEPRDTPDHSSEIVSVDRPATPAAPAAAPVLFGRRATDRRGSGSGAESRPSRAQGAVVQVPTERLEELTRLVGQSATAHLRIGLMLKDRFGVDPASCSEYNDLSRTLNDLQDRATRTQMVPVATITDQLHRAVRDLSRSLHKEVRWEVRGTDTEIDRGVLHQLSDSLLHLVRNAVDHGIEPSAQRIAMGKPPHGSIRLHAMQLGSEVIIAVTDDGRGIDTAGVGAQAARHGIDTEGLSADELLGLTFRPGLSTTAFVTDVSGRGVGLDVVRTNVEAVRGRVEVRSEPGLGTEYRIIVPITLAVLRCLLVEAGGQRFALPFHRVVLSQAFDQTTQDRTEGHPVAWVKNEPVRLSMLADTLGIGSGAPSEGPLVILADTSRRHAFQVDTLVGQRDVVLKGLSRLLPHLPVVAGASVEPDGSVLVVLDPPGLIQLARHTGGRATAGMAPAMVQNKTTRPTVLVVDDALTVRELQRSILERAGFEVRVATDGQQAMAKLAEAPSDIVLTDVEMPTMDGFELTEAIRASPSLANTPVLILSSRSSAADRQRGLDAGADGYIIKSSFDEASLLGAVNRLLGAKA